MELTQEIADGEYVDFMTRGNENGRPCYVRIIASGISGHSLAVKILCSDGAYRSTGDVMEEDGVYGFMSCMPDAYRIECSDGTGDVRVEVKA